MFFCFDRAFANKDNYREYHMPFPANQMPDPGRRYSNGTERRMLEVHTHVLIFPLKAW